MMREELTRTRLLAHCAAYPLLQIEDLFKYLFQSAFGCEHAVTAEDRAIAYIKKESEARIPTDAPAVEELDGAYSRVHLSYLDLGLSPQTLGKLFCRSAKAEPCGALALTQKLQIARDMIAEGRLPFAIEEFDRLLSAWQREGYPAIHHSDAFRLAYHPAYRVIANAYVAFLPLLAKIDTAKREGARTVSLYGVKDGDIDFLTDLLAQLYGEGVVCKRKNGGIKITLT